MAQASSSSEPKFRRKLSRTFVLTIIPLALLPILIVGSIAYFGARNIIRDQSYAQLSAIETNLENQINSWISEKHIFLYNTTQESALASSINRFFTLDPGDPNFEETGNTLISNLTQANSQRREALFNYFLLVNPNGTILASSIDEWEGEQVQHAGLFESLTGTSVQSLVAYRLAPVQASDIIILTAVPVRSEDNTLLGAVLAVSREDELRPFLQTAEIYASSRAYFINNNQTYLGVTKMLQNIVRLEPAADQNQAMEPLISEAQSAGDLTREFTYPSFQEESVLGAFTWIPKLNSALVVEVPAQEVFSNLNDLLPIAFALLIGLTLILFFLIRYFANRITNPVVQIASSAEEIAQGRWQKRVDVQRQDEIGLLAYSFNQMADQLSGLYRSLEEQVQERTDQIYAISKIEQKMSAGNTIKELYNITTAAIKEGFDFSHVSIFELNPSRRYATLRSVSGERASQMNPNRYTISTRIHALISAALTTGEPRSTSTSDENPNFEHDRLPGTQAAAIIPLYYQKELFGILSIQSKNPIAFTESMLTALETITKQLTINIQRIRSLEATEVNLEETSRLYQSSQRVTQAESWDEVITILTETFQEISFISGVFLTEGSRFHVRSIIDPENARLIPPLEWLPVSRAELEERLPGNESFLIIKDLDNPLGLPSQMMELPKDLGCEELVLFPIYEQKRLSALIMFGSRETDAINPATIQPYANLVEMVETTLEKLSALETVNQQLAELQTIQEIGQTVSQETNLDQLYKMIHQQVKRLLGDVNFFISLYDTEKQEIQVPYMYSRGSIRTSVPPFPLGEGLTSILIRTKSPLMLVENTYERAQALGAKLVGDPPRSWLGVPLLIRGEPIGTITVQDLEREHAFTNDDMEFLSTLADQVGIAIRNTLTLEETRARSQRQQQLFEASSKIRSSTDIHTILETTAQEISELLHAHRARIQIQTDQTSPPEPHPEEVTS
jgi:GAF domain-containing protein/HAMP domain-containing protein